MALLWIEGFEGFGTTIGAAPSPAGIVARKYPAIKSESFFDIETGRLSGYALKLDVAGGYIGTPALTTDQIFIIGFAVKFETFSSTSSFIRLYDGVTSGIGLYVTVAGELEIKRGGTSLEVTAGLGLSIDTWYYIEMKVVCSDTGHYTVRVGEAIVLDNDGDTKAGANNYHDRFRLNNTGSSTTSPTFDDLYCLDGAGAANNDFLGNSRVTALLPNGVGNSNDLTPSAGANFTCMDEVIADDDTTYVESGTSTHKDTYNYDDIDDTYTGIKGLQINTLCRETDASAFSIKTLIRPGVVDHADAGQAIGTTNYVTKILVSETNPDTAASWLYNEVNDTEFGIEVA